MPTPAHTIQDVITALDQIIRTCEEEGSRQAYFAVLYKAMTEAVRDAILAGHFEDGPRMEIDGRACRKKPGNLASLAVLF